MFCIFKLAPWSLLVLDSKDTPRFGALDGILAEVSVSLSRLLAQYRR